MSRRERGRGEDERLKSSWEKKGKASLSIRRAAQNLDALIPLVLPTE